MGDRRPRAPLPERRTVPGESTSTMTHDDLVEALRDTDGLDDVGRDPPNFHFRRQPFLHFHAIDGQVYADVKLGPGDFEPVWASTPDEREELLRRVRRHVQKIERSRKRR